MVSHQRKVEVVRASVLTEAQAVLVEEDVGLATKRGGRVAFAGARVGHVRFLHGTGQRTAVRLTVQAVRPGEAGGHGGVGARHQLLHVHEGHLARQLTFVRVESVGERPAGLQWIRIRLILVEVVC